MFVKTLFGKFLPGETLRDEDANTAKIAAENTISHFIIQNRGGNYNSASLIKLNGVTKTVRWSGNVPGTAGVAGTIRGYDIFSFTGINTTGSATSTTAYEVLGLVNGDFRTHA